MNEDILQGLYDTYGQYTDASSYEEFASGMANPEARKGFYDTYSKFFDGLEGGYEEFNLTLGFTDDGEFDEVLSSFDSAPKKQSEPILGAEPLEIPQEGTAQIPEIVTPDKQLEIGNAAFDASEAIQVPALQEGMIEENALESKDNFYQKAKATSSAIENLSSGLDIELGFGWRDRLFNIREQQEATINRLNELQGYLPETPEEEEALLQEFDQLQQNLAQLENNKIDTNPNFQKLVKSLSNLSVLNNSYKDIFPIEYDLEQQAKTKAAELDQKYEEAVNSGSWKDHTSLWYERNKDGLKASLYNYLGDVGALSASVADVLGAEKTARNIRYGGVGLSTLKAVEDLYNTKTSRFEGEPFERSVSGSRFESIPDSYMVVFDDEGNPLHTRNEYGNIVPFSFAGPPPELTTQKVKDEVIRQTFSERDFDFSRTINSARQSMIDFGVMIAGSRGLGALTSPSVVRGSIGAIGGFQAYGDSYSQLLKEGKSPTEAAAIATGEATIIGLTESLIGPLETSLASKGLNGADFAKAVRSKRADLMKDYFTGKMGKTQLLGELSRFAKMTATQLGGEVAEEIVQESGANWIEGAVTGLPADPISLDEAADIAASTIATVGIPSIISGAANYGSYGTDLQTTALYQASQKLDQYQDILESLVSNGEISEAQMQKAYQYAEYINQNLSNRGELNDDQKVAITGLLATKKSLQDKLNSSDNIELSTRYQEQIEDIDKKVANIGVEVSDEDTLDEAVDKINRESDEDMETVRQGGAPKSTVRVDSKGSEAESLDDAVNRLNAEQDEAVNKAREGEITEEEVVSPTETEKVPSEASDEATEQVSEEEWGEFVDNGVVSEERVDFLAEKIRKGEQLSDREQSMRNSASEQVESKLRGDKKPQKDDKLNYQKKDGTTKQLTYSEEKEGWVDSNTGRKQNSRVQEIANEQFSNQNIQNEKTQEPAGPERTDSPRTDDQGLPQDSEVAEEERETVDDFKEGDSYTVISSTGSNDGTWTIRKDLGDRFVVENEKGGVSNVKKDSFNRKLNNAEGKTRYLRTPQDSEVTEEGQETTEEQTQVEETIDNTKTETDGLQETKKETDEVLEGGQSEERVEEEIASEKNRINEIEEELNSELSSLQSELKGTGDLFSKESGGIFKVLDEVTPSNKANERKAIAKAFGNMGDLSKKQKEFFGEERLQKLKDLHKEWKELSKNQTPTNLRKRRASAKQQTDGPTQQDTKGTKEADKKTRPTPPAKKRKTNSQIRKESWDEIKSLLGESGIAFDPKNEADKQAKIIKALVRIAKTYLEDGYDAFKKAVGKNAPNLSESDVKKAYKEAGGEVPVSPRPKTKRKEEVKTALRQRFIERILADDTITQEEKDILLNKTPEKEVVPVSQSEAKINALIEGIEDYTLEELEVLFELIKEMPLDKEGATLVAAMAVSTELSDRGFLNEAAIIKAWVGDRAARMGRAINNLGQFASHPKFGVPAILARIEGETRAVMEESVIDGEDITRQQDLDALFGDGVTIEDIKEALAAYKSNRKTSIPKSTPQMGELKGRAAKLVREGKKQMSEGLSNLAKALRKSAGFGPQLTGEVLNALGDIAIGALKAARGKIIEAKTIYNERLKSYPEAQGTFDQVVDKLNIDVEAERKKFAAKSIAERLNKPKKSKSTKKDAVDRVVDAIISRAKKSKVNATNKKTKTPIEKLVEQAKQGDVQLELLEQARLEVEQNLRDSKTEPEQAASILNEIDDLIAEIKGSPFKGSDIRAAFRNQAKDMDKTISEVMEDVYVKGKIVDSIAAEIVKRTGVSPEDAKKYERIIKKVVNDYLAERKAKQVIAAAKREEARVKKQREKWREQWEKEVQKHEEAKKKAAEKAASDADKLKVKNALLEIKKLEKEKKRKEREFNQYLKKLQRSSVNPRNLQEILQKFQEGLRNGYLSKMDFAYMFGDRYGLKNISAEDLKELQDLSNQIAQEENKYKRELLMGKLSRKFEELKSTNVWESLRLMLMNIAYTFMLSSVKTAERASTGFGTLLAWDMANSIGGQIFQGLSETVLGKRGGIDYRLRVIGLALSEGFFSKQGINSGLHDVIPILMGNIPTKTILDERASAIEHGYINRLTSDVSGKFLGSIRRQIKELKSGDKVTSRTADNLIKKAFGQNYKIGNRVFKVGEIIASIFFHPLVLAYRGILAADALISTAGMPFNTTMIASDKALESSSFSGAKDLIKEVRKLNNTQYREESIEIAETEADDMGLSGYQRRKYITNRSKQLMIDAVNNGEIRANAEYLTEESALMNSPETFVGKKISDTVIKDSPILDEDSAGTIAYKFIRTILKTFVLPFGKVVANAFITGVKKTYGGIAFAGLGKAERRFTGEGYEVHELTSEEKRRLYASTVSSLLVSGFLISYLFDFDDEEDTFKIKINEDAGFRITGGGHSSFQRNKNVGGNYKPYSVQYKNENGDWVDLIADYRPLIGIGNFLAPMGEIYDSAHLGEDSYYAGVRGEKGSQISTVVGQTILGATRFGFAQSFVGGLETGRDMFDLALSIGANDLDQVREDFGYIRDKTANKLVSQYTKPAFNRLITQQYKAFTGEPIKEAVTLAENIMKDNNLLDIMLDAVKVDGLGNPIIPDVDIPFLPGPINSAWQQSIKNAREKNKGTEFILSRPGVTMPTNYYMRPNIQDTGVSDLPDDLLKDVKILTAQMTGESVDNAVEDLKQVISDKNVNKVIKEMKSSNAEVAKTVILTKFFNDNGVDVPEEVSDWKKLRDFLKENHVETYRVGGKLRIRVGKENKNGDITTKVVSKDAQYNGMPSNEELELRISSNFGAGNIKTQDEIKKLPKQTQKVLKVLEDNKYTVGEYEVDEYTTREGETYFTDKPKVYRELTDKARDKFIKFLNNKASEIDTSIPHNTKTKVKEMHSEMMKEEEALYMMDVIEPYKDALKKDDIYFYKDDMYVGKRDEYWTKGNPNAKYDEIPDVDKVRGFLKENGMMIKDGKLFKRAANGKLTPMRK